MAKPIRVEFLFCSDAVADGADLLIQCDVTLGKAQYGSSFRHGDGSHEVEVLAVVEDPSGAERADLIDLLPLGTVEDLAVVAASALDAAAELDAAEREADYRREEQLLGGMG